MRENLIDMTYKLDQTKTAFVLSSMLHVCGELKRKRKNIFKVPLTVNEKIITFL